MSEETSDLSLLPLTRVPVTEILMHSIKIFRLKTAGRWGMSLCEKYYFDSKSHAKKFRKVHWRDILDGKYKFKKEVTNVY